MNKKGFTLIELLMCLVLLGFVLGLGLYVTRDTLSTSLSTLTDVSINQIYDAAELYVTENGVSWINIDNKEYTCLSVDNLVDMGYFDYDEVTSYNGNIIKVERLSTSKVVNSVRFVDRCEN